jgi:putative ABC transport system permease protein
MALATKTGAFDTQRGSVAVGRAVSLPSHLLLLPLLAWIGGILLCVRVAVAVASRLWLPANPRFGPVIIGTVARSLRRRSWSLAAGIAALGLVVAFGASLAIFTATYDAAKANDANFAVGSDLRVTPSVLDAQPPSAEFAAKLRVPGVASVSPVVFKLENSVLLVHANRTPTDLAAIDVATFARTAALSDSFFVGRSSASALAAMQSDPLGLLVDSQTAADLAIEPGDSVRVLLALGTKHQTAQTFHVIGFFTDFPGFPQHITLVANLRLYEAATHSRRIDFFLARTTDHSDASLAAAATRLRLSPGSHTPILIDSSAASLAKDQSSLTALDVSGLLRLDLLFTLPMSATAIAILIFGLMLQRRREYVTLCAHGMYTREIFALILGEAAFVALSGIAAGILVGTATSYLLVHVLQPLFVLPPDITIPPQTFAALVTQALGATLAFALVGTLTISHLKPTETLREA